MIKPVNQLKVPFNEFRFVNERIQPEILSAFSSFLNSTSYILGDQVRAFEKAYAAFSGIEHCIGVSNGLDALVICLRCLDIGPGDEVILPAHTYYASALAVEMVGARCVFIEPDVQTLNMDIQKIKHAITSKTRAIMPVHLYGQACNMNGLMEIANAHRLAVIEDNAQSHGAEFEGRKTGTFGTINATSFYPTKNLGAYGDAGAITTSNPALAEKARVLRNYGSREKNYFETRGYNARLDELHAALLSVKLIYLNSWNEERVQIAGWYRELLQTQSQVRLTSIAEGATSVYHLFTIRVKEREQLRKFLEERAIGTLVHYPVPVHLQKSLQHLGYKKGDFPIAENIAETILSLPMYPGLSREQVDYVCREIHNFYQS